MGVGPTQSFEYQKDPPKINSISPLSRDFSPVIFAFKQFLQIIRTRLIDFGRLKIIVSYNLGTTTPPVGYLARPQRAGTVTSVTFELVTLGTVPRCIP